MSVLSHEEFLKVCAAFASDIVRNGDTTNDRYYEMEKLYAEQVLAIDDRVRVAIDALLKKANQLMWVNLTLQRATLSEEKKKATKEKKEVLLDFFRKVKL